jgi:rare lipoprotein A
MASWYGSAFHGRLTANGEVYDMTHLTAAHPTMPLPSYARVTNVENGTSLVVRVNDRGPFVNGRIIDLSQRSAELLGTKGNGVARVEVEYLGRAPLHGQDDQFLMASYRPGGRGPQPSDGLPTGVMMAMNGASPTSAPSASVDALRRPRTSVGPTGSITRAAGSTASDPVLPRTGPIIPQRPYAVTAGGRAPAADRFGALSYADRPVNAAGAALESLAVNSRAGDRPSDRLVAAWQRNAASSAEGWPSGGFHVSLGTFSDHDEAVAIAERLGGLGKVTILPASGGMASAILSPDGRADIDTILRAAWQAGAGDAMTMRD